MALNNATVSILGGQIYTVRWQLKNITTLAPGECVDILKSYCRVRYLVECLGHSAFILEFYITFDIILLRLTSDCFIIRLKLRDPFKSYKIVSSIRLQWILAIQQCNVDKFVCVSDARWEQVCKRNRFRVWIHLKRCHFPDFNTISNPLGPFNCLAELTFLLVFLLIIGLLLCSIKFEHPKVHLKYLFEVINVKL